MSMFEILRMVVEATLLLVVWMGGVIVVAGVIRRRRERDVREASEAFARWVDRLDRQRERTAPAVEAARARNRRQGAA